MKRRSILPRTASPRRPAYRSRLWQLAQAALLTIFLMPFGSVALESATITCGFGGYAGATNCTQTGFYTGVFDFGPYRVDLEFEAINGPFALAITDIVDPNLVERLDEFPGHECVPLDGVNCVEFEVEAPPPGETTWEGFYNLFISWLFNTEDLGFVDTPDGRIRMLHNRGDTPGNSFDTDITIPGSYIGPLIIEFAMQSVDDPAIGGRDDNFQTFLVTQAPTTVPEPATMALFGSGLGALLYHRRRRRTSGAPPRG